MLWIRPIEPDFSRSLFHDYSSWNKGCCVKGVFWNSHTYLETFPPTDIVGHILTIRISLIAKVEHLLVYNCFILCFGNCGFGHIYWRNPYGKLHFCAVEAKKEIEIHPVLPEAKIRKCSI